MKTRSSLLLALVLATCLAAGCRARRDFPEANVGYHSPSYNVVFGRLQKLRGVDEDAPPVWVVHFGSPQEAYQGELALTSPSQTFILGYSGGEPVELRGHLLDQPTTDAFNGRWYVVDSIQLWSGYRQ